MDDEEPVEDGPTGGSFSLNSAAPVDEESVETGLPESWWVGKDLDWNAPLIDVSLWVELPFWLMTGDGPLTVEHAGISFEVLVSEACYELFMHAVTDSRRTVRYLGPWPPHGELLESLDKLREQEPGAQFAWRKCRTVVKIPACCHEGVFEQGFAGGDSASAAIYRAELCRAHIPVLNRLIQDYRLATYDYFAFEVAPWDVPSWMLEHRGRSVTTVLLPYKEWDRKPRLVDGDGGETVYELISHQNLAANMQSPISPGELELMDALNLMQRGDYSGAVRRVMTAIEVVVEAAVEQAMGAQTGEGDAARFLRKTRMRFFDRVEKYEAVTGRTFPTALRKQLDRTRKLRHTIVHDGYRISVSDRGAAQQSVDTGRWIFNWFENNESRAKLRETRLALRATGRDMDAGVFPHDFTDAGIVIQPMRLSPVSGDDAETDERFPE